MHFDETIEEASHAVYTLLKNFKEHFLIRV